MEPMMEARGLTKRYGEVTALAGLDLTAPAGRVLAVLGPNGAGKTTFVRTMATLTPPDAGTLRVAGVDVARTPPGCGASSASPASTPRSTRC
jgi:ABC-2 type transport system ATP-binding protein